MKVNIRMPRMALFIPISLVQAIGGLAISNAQVKSAEPCEVRLTSPAEGDPVGPDGSISGIARIPNDTFLWVFVHRKNINGWWPQGNGPAEIDSKTGRFDVFATYGQDRDHGAFEIAVAVVSPEVNEVLTKWFDTAQAKGYPPIRFPSTYSGCRVIRITVMKG